MLFKVLWINHSFPHSTLWNKTQPLIPSLTTPAHLSAGASQTFHILQATFMISVTFCTTYTIIYLIFLGTTFLFNLIIISANYSEITVVWAIFILIHYIHTYKNIIFAHQHYIQYALGNRCLRAGSQDIGGKRKVKSQARGCPKYRYFLNQFPQLN